MKLSFSKKVNIDMLKIKVRENSRIAGWLVCLAPGDRPKQIMGGEHYVNHKI